MSNASPKSQAKSLSHFTAGLFSGLLSAITLQPIDLLKTRVQQSSGHTPLRSVLTSILRPSSSSSSSSSSSVLSLWRGTVPSALRTSFGSAIYLTTLASIRSHASTLPLLSSTIASHSSSSSLAKLSNTGNLLSGALARAFAGFCLMPLTVIKVRYESSLYAYTSLAHAGRDILRAHGARGFFAGFGATAVRDAPYAGLYVLFYEQSKRRLAAGPWFPPEQARGGKTMGVSRAAAINFSSALAAGVLCSVLTNPFDAVKTRIQLRPEMYRNMFHAARKMLAEEGVRSMWDGLALRMSRKALSSALAWTVYEELMRRAEGWGGRAVRAL